MQAVLTATAIMGGLAGLFGLGLALAHRFLAVEEDPRLDAIEDLLPGSNCGACGEAGCRAFAEALIRGETSPAACSVSDEEAIESIASLLGVDPGQGEKRVARLHCAGDRGKAVQIAEYTGVESCAAAHLVSGGGKACNWGCLGLGDCDRACTFDAIAMSGEGLPVVSAADCTACGDCVDACPRDLFEILPVSQKLLVQCKAPLAGDAARALCQVACDACGRCAQDAPGGLIEMENNLPVIDYAAGGPATPEATRRCPTGAIVWLEGQQFARPRRTAMEVRLD
ncbi:MAG: (Fe-S)-binding protein [Phycisphaeraceae bacterium]